MNEIIIEILEKIGYLGIFLLITLENVFPPIPSEIILLFGGFMTTYTNLKLIFVILIATVGSYLGGLILYSLGRILNNEKIKKFSKGKIANIINLNEDIDKANDWFDKKGAITVFICRFIPIVRSLISIPAGMNKMNLFKFSLYTIIATLMWNSILVYLGARLGENWPLVLDVFSKYSFIILIILMVLLLLLSYMYYKKRIKKKHKSF